MMMGAVSTSHLLGGLTMLCMFIVLVACQEEILGLAEEAFDDQYVGCRKAMKTQIEDKDILGSEMERNRHFRRAWKESGDIWQMRKKSLETSLPSGFTDNHGIALVAYTGFIRSHFTKAVRSAGRSYRDYMDNFHYKGLHYYLTVALQLLSQDCRNSTRMSYCDVNGLLLQEPNTTSHVKFGHILNTHAEPESHNGSSCLVLSCSGVPVEMFSQYPEEMEVVIPGYEVFTLSRKGEDWLLVSTGKYCSHYNCAYIRGETSNLSVAQCITSGSGSSQSRRPPSASAAVPEESAAPLGRMHGPATTGLISALIAVAVALV